MNKLVSSANRITSSSEALFKSLIYSIKNNWPRIEPCGTPRHMMERRFMNGLRCFLLKFYIHQKYNIIKGVHYDLITTNNFLPLIY